MPCKKYLALRYLTTYMCVYLALVTTTTITAVYNFGMSFFPAASGSLFPVLSFCSICTGVPTDSVFHVLVCISLWRMCMAPLNLPVAVANQSLLVLSSCYWKDGRFCLCLVIAKLLFTLCYYLFVFVLLGKNLCHGPIRYIHNSNNIVTTLVTAII